MQVFIWFGVEIGEVDCTKRKSSPWFLKFSGVQSLGSSFPWQWSWLKSTAEVWLYVEGWNHKMALKVELSENVEAEISTGSLWFSLSPLLPLNQSSENFERGEQRDKAFKCQGNAWQMLDPQNTIHWSHALPLTGSTCDPSTHRHPSSKDLAPFYLLTPGSFQPSPHLPLFPHKKSDISEAPKLPAWLTRPPRSHSARWSGF